MSRPVEELVAELRKVIARAENEGLEDLKAVGDLRLPQPEARQPIRISLSVGEALGLIKSLSDQVRGAVLNDSRLWAGAPILVGDPECTLIVTWTNPGESEESN